MHLQQAPWGPISRRRQWFVQPVQPVQPPKKGGRRVTPEASQPKAHLPVGVYTQHSAGQHNTTRHNTTYASTQKWFPQPRPLKIHGARPPQTGTESHRSERVDARVDQCDFAMDDDASRRITMHHGDDGVARVATSRQRPNASMVD